MSLQKNLEALSAQRNARKKTNRKSIIDTIMEISESRAAKVQSPSTDSLGGMQAAAGRKITPVAGGQHSMNDGHGHGSAAEVKGLNAQFNGNLQALVKASGGRITVGSGYRSMAEQKVLYDRYRSGDPRQKAPAAAPGKSNHNHGLAADLKYAAGGREFAHANAGKYGLRFPMSYEPWHIEPINAKAMRKK